MCLEKLGKIFLVVVNIAFFIGGGALLVVGLISIFKDELLYKVTNLITENLGSVFKQLDIVAEIDFVQLIKTNAIIICVVGGFLFALGFLGMCGACKMNSTCLMIYSVVVLVLLLAEVGLGVYAYMNAEEFEDKIQTGLRLAMAKTYKNGYRFDNASSLSSEFKGEELGFDLLQMYLQCCGVTNRSDWLEATNWDRNYTNAIPMAKVPPSCCVITDQDTIKSAQDLQSVPTSVFKDLTMCMTTGTTDVNNKVCYDELKDIIVKNQEIIIIVFVIIVAVQIVAVAFACYLKSNAKKKKVPTATLR